MRRLTLLALLTACTNPSEPRCAAITIPFAPNVGQFGDSTLQWNLTLRSECPHPVQLTVNRGRIIPAILTDTGNHAARWTVHNDTGVYLIRANGVVILEGTGPFLGRR